MDAAVAALVETTRTIHQQNKTSKMIKKPKKTVRFLDSCSRENVSVENLNPPPASELWYSNEELEEMKNLVKMANLAVNDACGDLDVVDVVGICRSAVLQQQEHCKKFLMDQDYILQAFAKTSKIHSETSVELARLHALVLEKDICNTDGSSITYDGLRKIVNQVADQGDDSSEEEDGDAFELLGAQERKEASSEDRLDDDDDDALSMGTIDELPQEDSWDGCSLDVDAFNESERKGENISAPLDTLVDSTDEPNNGRRPTHQKKDSQYPQRTERVVDDTHNMIHPRRILNPPSLLNFKALQSREKSTHGTPSNNKSWRVVSNENMKWCSKDATQKLSRPCEPLQTTSEKFEIITEPCSPTVQVKEPQSINKRSLEAGNVEELSGSFPSPSVKRQRRETAQEEAEGRRQVAHALIALARWEFRSCHLPKHP